jgi:hypothetical protein
VLGLLVDLKLIISKKLLKMIPSTIGLCGSFLAGSCPLVNSWPVASQVNELTWSVQSYAITEELQSADIAAGSIMSNGKLWDIFIKSEHLFVRLQVVESVGVKPLQNLDDVFVISTICSEIYGVDNEKQNGQNDHKETVLDKVWRFIEESKQRVLFKFV